MDTSWNDTVQMIHRCALGQGHPDRPPRNLPRPIWTCSYCAEHVDSLGDFSVSHAHVFHPLCLARYRADLAAPVSPPLPPRRFYEFHR